MNKKTLPHRISPLGWLLMAALALIWGGSFVANRQALTGLPVLTIVAIRVGGGALALWLWIAVRGLPVPRGARWLAACAGMGMFNNILPFTLIVWGQQQIPAGLAGILNASTAVFGVLVAAAVFADERLTLPRLVGVVLGLAVTTPRAVIRAADPVLYIVPQDRPLVIATQVAPIHIDQIHVGQPVELVFSAFSSRTTPHLKGKVSVISADAFTDQKTMASFYRAEIVLDDGEIAKLEDQTLLPGMPVEAFIQTEAQTPLAYLLKPFTDYFSRAFRES